MATGYFNAETLEDKVVAYSIPPDLIRLGQPIHVATQTFDGKTVAVTSVYLVPTGLTFVPTGVVVRCTAASAITVGAQIDIRTSASGDIIAQFTLSSLTAASLAFPKDINGTVTATVAAGSSVSVSVDVVATGTSQTLVIDLFGYFVPTGAVMQ
jgi:hypothetical protein